MIKRIYGLMRRDIGIYLDGEKIGVIGTGQIKEFGIKQGEHRLKAKTDWFSSNTITLKDTDSGPQIIQLSEYRHGRLGKWLILSALIILGLRFALEKFYTINPLFSLMVIILLGLYLLYPFTVGRKNYLKLRKE